MVRSLLEYLMKVNDIHLVSECISFLPITPSAVRLEHTLLMYHIWHWSLGWASHSWQLTYHCCHRKCQGNTELDHGRHQELMKLLMEKKEWITVDRPNVSDSRERPTAWHLWKLYTMGFTDSAFHFQIFRILWVYKNYLIRYAVRKTTCPSRMGKKSFRGYIAEHNLFLAFLNRGLWWYPNK